MKFEVFYLDESESFELGWDSQYPSGTAASVGFASNSLEFRPGRWPEGPKLTRDADRKLNRTLRLFED